MENQVLSRDQMWNLKKLGIDTSKASMCFGKGARNERHVIAIYTEVMKLTEGTTPTFTLQDILELLPKEIQENDNQYQDNVWCLVLSTRDNEIWYWCYDYDCRQISFNGDSLLQSAYQMLVWVAQNGCLKTK